ncbi:MAG: PAS domain S-box protein [Chloroflexota bacterium]
MNQTFDPVQTTQILYEISMSIGTSVELRPMLKTSLSTILKKLNCISGGVYQKMEQLDGACRLEAVYTIPRQPQRSPTYQEALDQLPICPAQTDYAHFLAELPAVRQSQEGHTYHILELPDFGVLLLVKNREALPEPLLKSLAPLLNKLAAAALACVNAAKLRQSEERYRLFTETTFDGILVHDGPVIREINPALAELIAYKPEELVGKNIFDFLDPSCHELAAANALQLTTTPYPLVAVKKDGTRLPVEVTDREYTETGRTYRITAVRSLSQQKQLETELAGLVERRTRQVQIATEVAQAIAAAANLEDLYKRIVTEVTEKFGYYHAQVLRYDPQLDAVKLAAGYGVVGEKMLALGHQIPLHQGLIGAAAAAGETFLRPDLADDPDWKANQLLPETRGEIAVPIKLGDQILGVLDVQSNQANALDKEDQMLLEGLCGQIAVAINTTRLTTDLLETSTFLNSVIDNIPNMIFVKDAEELRFIRLNQIGLSYFGLELDQIIGKNDFDFFPEEQAEFFVAKDNEVLASGQLLDIPEETIDSPFGARVLHTTKVPVMGPDGNPKYLLGISHDITEQKDIETELVKFKLGLECSTDAIFMTDTNGCITYVNDAFVEIYGYTKEEAIGNTPRILKSGVIPQEQYQHFWQTLLSGGIVAGEIVNKAKNGRLIHIEGNNNPIQDDSGQIIGFLAMHRDITERKQTAELLQANERRYQQILDAITHMVLVKGAESRIVWANKAFRDYYGMSNEALQAKVGVQCGQEAGAP